MKQPKTWYLIADGGRARVVERRQEGRGWETILAMDATDRLAPTHALDRDRPGRAGESMSPARHAIEPRVDAHQERKHAFITAVIAAVAEKAGKRRCDGLVLVAPDRILHELRTGLGEELKRKVTDEIERDLTKVSDNDLDAHLARANRLPG
jgi:protein required for attachment to host cells